MTSEIVAALHGCARGDEGALHALVEAEGPLFMGVALRMVRRSDLAREAVRAAMLDIWHGAADAPVSAEWAFSMLRQQARAVLRGGDALLRIGADDLAVMQQNRQYLAPGEAWRFLPPGPLRDALGAMDTPVRDAILLVHAAGFTMGEIAALQKVPLGIAHRRLSGGLEAIAGDYAAEFAEGRFTPVDAVLLPLDLSAPPAVGAEGLWPEISPHLAPTALAEAEPVPAVVPRAKRPSVVPFAAGALGVALGVLGMMAVPERQPAAVGVLLSPTGVPQAVVQDFADGTVTLRLLADLGVPDGQVAQVWTRPSLERGAVSLGIVGGALSAEGLPAPMTGQRYEITAEPAPGTRPTGAVLATGTVAAQP